MEVTEHQGETLKYLAIEPDGYDPSSRYPMVILLHGYGSSMSDLARLCPLIDQQGYIYICPSAPYPVRVGTGMVGYSWSPADGGGGLGDTDRSGEALASLFEEVMERYAVEARRVILGGFSQGGFMTYRCGLMSPEVFRGLVVLSSRVADHEALRERLPASRTQAIFMAHGTADSMISVEDSRKSRQFLEEEGYAPEYREYPMGHEVSQDVVNDLTPWIRGVVSPHRPVS